MMRMYGYEVIEYSNEGSESEANEKVVMLTKEEYEELYGDRKKTDFYGDTAVIGSDGHRIFEERLIPALRERLQPTDIICHPFGHAHEVLTHHFPNHQHVETGIGYATLMKNSYKIFESYTWMSRHQGMEKREGHNYEFVIPNYYDLTEWNYPAQDKSQANKKYIAFLGRIGLSKGMNTVKAVADYSPYPILLCGQGDPTPWSHPNIHYIGPITGKNRCVFLSNAIALLMPSDFIEPFAGANVEAQLCGTPVISVDNGAFSETIIQGYTGYRCHTLDDYIEAVNNVKYLNRRSIRARAQTEYSLQACGRQYDAAFQKISALHRSGWYETNHQKLEHKPDWEIEDFVNKFKKAELLHETFYPNNYLDSVPSHLLNSSRSIASVPTPAKPKDASRQADNPPIPQSEESGLIV